MKERLTRETALNLHRQMWTDMLLKLGNNFTGSLARRKFKQDWIQAHNYEDVECDCFLCEYDNQQKSIYDEPCKFCPIDWSSLSAKEDACCGDQYTNSKNSVLYESIWTCAPINEILNLPEKEGV